MCERKRERECVCVCVPQDNPCLNFGKVLQIPLYKGTNACSLDTISYRSKTLLTTLNKLFEVLYGTAWKDDGSMGRVYRIHKVHVEKGTLARTYSFLTSKTFDTVCVAYFPAYCDATKAFDTVLIGGLFSYPNDIGIMGKYWMDLWVSTGY